MTVTCFTSNIRCSVRNVVTSDFREDIEKEVEMRMRVNGTVNAKKEKQVKRC